jgi:hypothetical protein
METHHPWPPELQMPLLFRPTLFSCHTSQRPANQCRSCMTENFALSNADHNPRTKLPTCTCTERSSIEPLPTEPRADDPPKSTFSKATTVCSITHHGRMGWQLPSIHGGPINLVDLLGYTMASFPGFYLLWHPFSHIRPAERYVGVIRVCNKGILS